MHRFLFVLAALSATLLAVADPVSIAIARPWDAAVSGQVVDDHGAPVAGADILSPDGRPDSGTITDARGHFELGGLPAGDIALIAVHRTGTAQMQARANGAAVTIALVPQAPWPLDPQIARQLAKLLQREGDPQGYLAEAVFDPDGAFELARQPDGTVPDAGVSAIALALARHDPKRAAAWAVQHVPAMRDKSLILESVPFAELIADTDLPLASQIYSAARAKVALPPEGSTLRDVGPAIFLMAALAGLADRVGDPEAGKLWEVAIGLTATAETPGARTAIGQEIVREAGRASLEFVEREAMKLPEAAWAPGLAAAARDNATADPESAARILALIGQNAATDDQAGRVAQAAYDDAACPVIEALGRLDAPAVLAIAHKVQNGKARIRAFAEAAAFQPHEQARELLREARMLATSDSSFAFYDCNWAKIAAVSWDIDHAQGRELFQLALPNPRANAYESGSLGQAIAVADYAYYSARMDAAQSRAMLEEEYARVLQNFHHAEAPGKQRQDQWKAQSLIIANLASAMAALDTRRAVQMRDKLPAQYGRHSEIASQVTAAIVESLCDPRADRAEIR